MMMTGLDKDKISQNLINKNTEIFQKVRSVLPLLEGPLTTDEDKTLFRWVLEGEATDANTTGQGTNEKGITNFRKEKILVDVQRITTSMQFDLEDWTKGNSGMTEEEAKESMKVTLLEKLLTRILNGNPDSKVKGLLELSDNLLTKTMPKDSKELYELALEMRSEAMKAGAKFSYGTYNLYLPENFLTLFEGTVSRGIEEKPVVELLKEKKIFPVILEEIDSPILFQSRAEAKNIYGKINPEVFFSDDETDDYKKFRGNLSFSGLVCGNSKEIIKVQIQG